MTLKSYLRMLLAAVTLLFVTSGCNDDDDKVGPPPSYSFSVAVSDVAQTEATVTVTPSNDQATYYYAAVKKAEFDTFESDAAYAQHILDNLKAIADKKVLPLSEYLATALVKGSAPQKITDLTAGTDYYAVALGMLTDGRFTSDLVKEAFKTDDAPEPELVISKAGGYFFGTSFGAFDNFTFWMSEDTVTEDMMDFTGEGTYLLFDLNVAVTGKATLPAGTFPVASGADAEENTIAPGADYGGGMMTGSAIVKINSDGTKNYLYIDGGALIVEGAGSSYVITAKVTSGGKEYEFKYEGGVSIYDTTGGGGDFELSIDVTNITATTATVNVTSSDETSSYYFDLFDEEDYQGYGGTPEGIAEFISDLLAYYQAQYPSMTLPQILSQIVSVGNDSYDFDGLTPGTKYYTFAIGVDATTGATTTTAVVKEFTTQAGSGGDGPELTLTMRAGDKDGNNKTTCIYTVAQSSAATSAIYWLSKTSAVEQKLAAGETYESIVAGGNAFSAQWMTNLNSAGGIGLNYDKCQPGESWTMILKVVDADGNATVKHVEATTETGQGGETGDGPELTLTMKAGDHTGADPTTKITCLIKSSGVVSAKAGLWTKATIDDAIGKGMTIEQIINNEQNGEAIEDQYITGINGAGLNYTWGGASPATEYTAIIKVTDAAGNSTIKSATGATDAAGEATTVELKNLAQGEMQYWGDAYSIAENDYANWTIYLADATVDLSTLNGTGDVLMMELNTAKAVTTEITPGTYTVMPNRSKANFIAFSCVPGYVSGSSPYGTWYITEKSAKNMLTSGTVVVAKSGDNYTFTIDLLDQSTNTTFKGSYTGAMNYVNATAQSAQMRTPWANAANAPKRLASVAVMQNIVDVEMTVSNSLSFEKKPAATYEATISNVANIKKPLGLKKHFIKK
ncbi:hypothetical protein [Alistipes finegoldii]|uniref:hypothetical protein n=1 Tax=Alistipes finegoldii TaxID=214856 RepID=UPI002666C325|nr:hypothetical protein [Alistipes finegoldii]